MEKVNGNGSKKPEQTRSQPAQSIAPDIPNTAAGAELLRIEQLSLEHNGQLAGAMPLIGASRKDELSSAGKRGSLECRLLGAECLAPLTHD